MTRRKQLKTVTDADHDALERALVMACKESPQRAEQIHSMLQSRPWRQVAEFASYSCQFDSLRLKPWMSPPCCITTDEALEEALAAPPGVDGDRACGELVQRLRKLGLSIFEPDPMTAIAAAENQRHSDETRTGESEVHRGQQ